MFTNHTPQQFDLFINGLMMLVQPGGPAPAQQPAPAAPVPQTRPAPPQRTEQFDTGFCYACNARVLITAQKTCRFCANGFVEIEEPSARPANAPAQAAPARRADALR